MTPLGARALSPDTAREPGSAPTSTPLLRVERLTKSFGGVTAVAGVSFTVAAGEIVAMIGPNGAGKTTVFNLISSVLTPTQGEIWFSGHLTGSCPRGFGQELAYRLWTASALGGRAPWAGAPWLASRVERLRRLAPHEVAGLGIARTFQNLELFVNMSAIENVMVGRHRCTSAGLLAAAWRLPRARREERAVRAAALDCLEWVGLADRAHLSAGSLSYGQQRLLELARALAAEPRLLLLDEPAAGFTSQEREALSRLIRRIRDQGVTVLLVEHDMNLVMGTADRVIVLDYGQKIAEGTPEEIQADPRVIAAYLGEEP